MMIKRIYRFGIVAMTKVSPALASRVLYLRGMKKSLRLKNPQLFSEKLMKLKLDNYIENPTVWQCADKLGVREYAKARAIPEENLPAILGTYEDANEIDFEVLPDKFALKCTHGAGFNIICHDKSRLNQRDAVTQLNKWLVTPFGLETAETHYGKIPPKIICEAFIENEDGSLPNDYKVYCFGGVPLYVMACTEREGKLSKVNIMDLNWNDTGYIKSEYASSKNITKPVTLSKMLEMAIAVSSEFPFVRVDFYEDRGVPILGEMTFTPHACVNNNMTIEGQVALGKLLNLEHSSKGKIS